MGLFSRLAAGRPTTEEGRYVCTLCGARYEEQTVVVCPKCRGFVVERKRG